MERGQGRTPGRRRPFNPATDTDFHAWPRPLHPYVVRLLKDALMAGLLVLLLGELFPEANIACTGTQLLVAALTVSMADSLRRLIRLTGDGVRRYKAGEPI